MISASEFRTATCQATLFTAGSKFEPARLFREVFLPWLTRFDGEPTILPLPDGAPVELARIQLKSSDGSWACNVSPVRIDIHGHPQPGGESVEPAEVIGVASEMLAQYADQSGVRVGRLAAVIKRYVVIADPGIVLARHFCKETWQTAPLNRPEDFELHARKVYVMPNAFEVNSWARARTGNVTVKPSAPKKAVLFEQDINTLAEGSEEKSYSREHLSQFYAGVQSEFDAILWQYFPPPSLER